MNERRSRWTDVLGLTDLIYVVIRKKGGRVQVLNVPRHRTLRRLAKKKWEVVGVVRNADENPEDVLLGLVLTGAKRE